MALPRPTSPRLLKDDQKVMSATEYSVKEVGAISELDRLAPLFGLPDALSLVAAACGSISSEAARAYEARERESQITDDLIDRIAAHPEDYDMAANKDPNARLEAETPDD